MIQSERTVIVMPIGERIKRIRKSRGMSQKQVADALNVTQGAVSQWEHGVTEPLSIQIYPLAQLFGITADELLEKSDPDTDIKDFELFELRERLRRDPNLRVLFSAARTASPEHIRAAAAMLKALEPEEFSE